MCAPFILSTTTGSFELNVAHADGPPPQTTICGRLQWICDGISNASSAGFGWIFDFILTVFIKLGVFILDTATYFFNILVDRTIIQFGSTEAGKGVLTEGVKTGINTAWSAFRDLANILIIGFFTFIAVNIILGTRTYGDKKLIARVLIIAILINFSLLFTKIIIDFSNFTATQFYKASTNLHTNTAAGATADTDNATDGIGGRLVSDMGVPTVNDTFHTLNTVRQNSGIPDMILYGILSLIVSLGAAAVLLYGCYILASRAILLVFLMITSSLAFASYLIPNIQSSGWDRWWRSLIESAILAPLLMLLLWATLIVADALKYTGGSLGNLTSNPGSTAGLGSLFSFIIILGLLFATFKVSSSFSSKIAGFNYAGILPRMVGRGAMGAMGAIPFGLRQTVGNLGYRYEKSRLAQARLTRDEAADLRRLEANARSVGNVLSADMYGKKARKLENEARKQLIRASRGAAIAGSRMNIMDTKAAQAIAKAAGVGGVGMSGKDTRSFAQSIEDRTAAAETLAARITPTAGDKSKIEEAAVQAIYAQQQATTAQLTADRDAKKAAAEQQRKATEELLKTARESYQKAEMEREENQKSFVSQIEKVREELARTNQEYGNAMETIKNDQVVRNAINTRPEHERLSLLNEQNERIRQARVLMNQFETTHPSAGTLRDLVQQKDSTYKRDSTIVDQLKPQIETLKKRIGEIDQPFKDAQAALDKHVADTQKAAEKAAKEAVAQLSETAANVAQRVGETQGNIVTRMIDAIGSNEEVGRRVLTFSNKEVGERVRSLFTKKQQSPSLHELLKRLEEEDKK
jgi:Skp family chaperone for outer membrane proteins